MRKYSKNSWYSVIISLLMIWFLLVLTSWVFDLILREMYDNRGLWSYIRAYAWAESWQELALLKIKEKWYGIYDFIEHDVNNRSVVLSKNPLNKDDFNRAEDVFISYDLNSTSITDNNESKYDWELWPLEYDIIPLFYEDNAWVIHKIDENRSGDGISFTLDAWAWDENDLVWNIVSESSWISWIGSSDTLWNIKKINGSNLDYDSGNINEFLSSLPIDVYKNYLVLFNSNNSEDISYTLESMNPLEFFTQPKIKIVSSGQIWKYKQNINTDLNNTQYLNILKYSIYSN